MLSTTPRARYGYSLVPHQPWCNNPRAKRAVPCGTAGALGHAAVQEAWALALDPDQRLAVVWLMSKNVMIDSLDVHCRMIRRSSDAARGQLY